MTPFFKTEHLTLYHADCLRMLPELEPGGVDLLVLDPPYGRVLDADWDRIGPRQLEELLRKVFAGVLPALKETAAIYCFCWPTFSGRLQTIMSDYFDVLGDIVWCKRRPSGAQCGMQAKAHLEDLRTIFPETERIVFAEMRGHSARCELQKDAKRSGVYRPLIEYFSDAKRSSGLTGSQIQARMHELTGSRYVFERHAFSKSQWEMPTRQQYEAAQTFMPLPRCYDDLRAEYDSLRIDITVSRRWYSASRDTFTDLWWYAPILAGSRDRVHPAQKPIAIIEDMIRTSCPPGGLVLDLFAGSGVTGQAAANTGRGAVLVEKDINYVSNIMRYLKISS